MGLRSIGARDDGTTRIWSAPDERFLDEAQRGERFVARARLVANAALAVIFCAASALGSTDLFFPRAAGAAAAGSLLSLGVLAAASRPRAARWLPFVSSLLDLSLVSAAFLLLAPVDPLRASNFAMVYLLVIAATCLRLDARVSIVTGAAAILQYGLVFWVIFEPEALGAPAGSDPSWVWSQGLLMRSLLLGAGSLLAAIVVVRQQRLRDQAVHDGLTHLLNRRYFDERFEIEVARAERSRESFTLILLDVDHFKQFNDAHGHAAGDRALRSVASILAGSFRTSDLLARWGGEELVGVLFGTRPATILQRVESARRAIEQARIAVRDERDARVTVSIGVATYPDDGATAAALLDVADQRLYRAKLAGRNRIVIDGGSARIDDARPAPQERRRFPAA